jgi:hypothetical protein
MAKGRVGLIWSVQILRVIHPPGTAQAQGRSLATTLTGDRRGPRTGDPDGTGTAP